MEGNRIVKVWANTGLGIRLCLDRDFPNQPLALVKGSIMRFSKHSADMMGMDKKSRVIFALVDMTSGDTVCAVDGVSRVNADALLEGYVWCVGVLPSTTNSRGGYKVIEGKSEYSAFEVRSKRWDEGGITEGIYFISEPFTDRINGDDIDLFPMEMLDCNVR